MASSVKIKRSAVEGKAPLTSDLELGELAVNTYDGKLFLKRNDGVRDYIREVGGNLVFEVKNQTGSTITKGTAVGFAGTLGASGKLLVQPFIANGTQPSEYFIGLVEDDILNGGEGYVVDHGKLLGLNTSQWSEGTVLYVSSTVAGALTSTRPQAPNNKITCAAVINSSTANGSLEVRVSVGSSLANDELVEISSPSNGQTLVYNSTSGRFENANISGSGSSVSVGDTPPNFPSQGDLWWNSTNGTIFVYYQSGSGNTWVDTTSFKNTTNKKVYLSSDGGAFQTQWATTVNAGGSAYSNYPFGNYIDAGYGSSVSTPHIQIYGGIATTGYDNFGQSADGGVAVNVL